MIVNRSLADRTGELETLLDTPHRLAESVVRGELLQTADERREPRMPVGVVLGQEQPRIRLAPVDGPEAIDDAVTRPAHDGLAKTV